MKKFLFFLIVSIALGGIILTSCGGDGSKLPPEEEVRNYGKYFVEKLAANQLDSLKVSYPDIAKADSLMPVKSDSIMVMESAPGQFDLTLAEGVTLKINRSEDGNITVTESKGLFVFPADKVDIAKKTGMWDDKLSDAQLNERMKDEEFFSLIESKLTNFTSNILKVIKHDNYNWEHLIPIRNNTSIPIKGADYKLRIEICCAILDVDDKGNDYWNETSRWQTLPGKDIGPSQTITYNIPHSDYCAICKANIVMNLSNKEIQEKFAFYSGKEYQEYLNSKK